MILHKKTFDNIAKWLRNIDEHASEGVERMILGNKCDMEDKRMVNKERGEGIAREHGIKFFETSAKDNINVEDAFMTLTQDILRKQLAGATKEETTKGVIVGDKNPSQSKMPGGCC